MEVRARRRVPRLAGAALVVFALVPVGSPASHCSKIAVHAGDDTVATPFRPVSFNLGEVGCQSDHAVNTNVIPRGITKVWGVVAAIDGTPSGGSINGTALSWSFNAVRSRWESQTVTVGPTAPVTATTSVGGVGQSVTYTRL